MKERITSIFTCSLFFITFCFASNAFAQNGWTTAMPMTMPRFGAATGVINGKIYVAGGHDSINLLNALEVYDPVMNSWSTLAPMPAGRYLAVAGVVGGKLYVLGGYNGSTALAAHELFTSSSCSQTPAGLVGWWAGDGDARDNTGVNNGVLNLFPTNIGMSVGHVGQSFFLQQANFEYVAVPDNNSLEMTTQFTLAAWVRQLGTFPPDQQIISKFGTSGNYAYQFSLSPNGGLRVDFSGDGTSYDALISPNNSIVTGTWQHVAATFNAGSVKLYVNGIEVASGTSSITSIYSNGTSPLNIRRDAGGAGQYFSGLIDEAMVFNRALSATEINDTFAPGIMGVCKSAPTGAGSNSQTQVGDQTITFENVMTAGTTTSLSIAPLSAGDLPTGYTHTGLAYDISTTAAFTGSISTCFHIPSITDAAVFSKLKVMHLEGNTLVDRTTGANFTTRLVCGRVTSLSPFVIANGLAPTAATVTISGQILSPEGRPIAHAIVYLTDQNGNIRQTRSSTFGYYNFEEVEAGGQSYIFSVRSKRYQFQPQVVTIVEDITNLDFTAMP